MIRTTSLIAALLVAAPAVAQADPPPTVEAYQEGIDAVLAEPHGEITLTQARDDMQKTSLLVRAITTSKTLRRCETEFATPKEKLNAGAKSQRSWRVDWGSVAEVRRDGAFKLELMPRKPVSTRTILEFPDSRLARDFGQAMDFLHQNCPG